MEKKDVENEILEVVSAKLKTDLSCDEIKTLCEAISHLKTNDLLTQLLERNMFSGFGAVPPEDKEKKN